MKREHPIFDERRLTSQDGILDKSKKVIYKSSLDALVILAICILVNLAIRIDFSVFKDGVGEASFTESLQLLMLIVSTSSFYLIIRERQDLIHAAVLIFGFLVVVTIREMDAWFDLIFHGAWVLPAALVTIVSTVYALRGGKDSVNQMATILDIRHMNTMIGGIVLLVVFSRLYGMGSFWHSVMQEHYVREVKNVSEESMELLCYCLIALGAVKTRLSLKH
ncbi:hypothetical protein GCM10007938_38330 [Vibrio zhanjiangensis]|uniref:Uncharacterized protein n=1 Tax=Vibrio zhanjiangensis TaxID=1046128 RepID=A0ABQ6F3F1_9VIBR|nr:hypothetical protein [Vibrio zhanjiangensis]GLT20050.1 hypothetical protein GCM10007938_38330 [Vibrio zhanjiangensis]